LVLLCRSNDQDSSCAANPNASTVKNLEVSEGLYYFIVVGHASASSNYFYQLRVTADLNR